MARPEKKDTTRDDLNHAPPSGEQEPGNGQGLQEPEPGGTTQGDGHKDDDKNASTDGPTYPDVDQRPTPDLDLPDHEWDGRDGARKMVTDIRQHVRQSHGLTPDKDLLTKIADYIEKQLGSTQD